MVDSLAPDELVSVTNGDVSLYVELLLVGDTPVGVELVTFSCADSSVVYVDSEFSVVPPNSSSSLVEFENFSPLY